MLQFLSPTVFWVFRDLWLFLPSSSAILSGDVIALKRQWISEKDNAKPYLGKHSTLFRVIHSPIEGNKLPM